MLRLSFLFFSCICLGQIQQTKSWDATGLKDIEINCPWASSIRISTHKKPTIEVNYQKEGEFNPPHDHNGVYSFVIWMKIPTKHFDQNKNPISLKSNTHLISAFQFQYTNILGQIRPYIYEMNPEMEVTMLFFPAKLVHGVFPFYNCDEDRISISGNISLNTTKIL